MRSASFIAGLLASVALAQPHRGHRHQHQKKDVVVTWETVFVTVTEIVDENHTETIFPAQPTTASSASAFSAPTNSAAKFIQTPVVVPSSPQPVVPSPSLPAVEVPAPSVSSVQISTPTVVAAPPPAETAVAPPVASVPSVPAVSVPVVAVPTPTVVAPPPAATSSVSSGGGGSQFSGDITYYTMGPTACGDDYTGQDSSVNVVALAHGYMGTASSYGPGQPANEYCGRKITISANGKTVSGEIRDKCMGCVGMDIDVSEKMFLELFGSTGVGRTKVSWSFA